MRLCGSKDRDIFTTSHIARPTSYKEQTMENGSTTQEQPSAETLEANFRTAVAAYLAVFEELKQAKADKKPLEELKPIVTRVYAAGEVADDALKSLIPFHKHGVEIGTYVQNGNAWATRVASLAAIGKDPLAPEYRRMSKAIFDEWKKAERVYADLGYRTVSAEDWFDSMPRQDVVPFGLWPALIIEREPGEEPVLHAVAMQSRHKGLQHAGTNLAKLKKKMRRGR
jgi:hypothetical protein